MNRISKHIIFGVILTTLMVHLFSCITPKKGPGKALALAKEQYAPFDAIIVPGVPFNNGTWDSVMKARVIWAYVLYKNGVTKNIIFSGAAVYSPYPEARIMGLYGQKLGIPKEHIFYDTLAKHSTENVFYSYKIAKRQGFKKLALATDPFQSFLLTRFIKRRFESCIYRLPFVTDTLAVYNGLNPVLDSTDYSHFKIDNFIPITESEGLFQRIRGTLGREIEWEHIPNGKLDKL